MTNNAVLMKDNTSTHITSFTMQCFSECIIKATNVEHRMRLSIPTRHMLYVIIFYQTATYYTAANYYVTQSSNLVL